ncbi:MAG: alpha/beta hydrolase, partial [Pseudomonadota bacterium]
AFWNSELELSVILKDTEEMVAQFAAMSAAAVTKFGAPEALSTGSDPLQAVWRTRTGRPGRALVFIHGGYWRRFCAADYAFVANLAHHADATFYNVDYRLMPDVRMAETVADAVNGVTLALAEVDEAVLVGHSAGAHLAIEAALRAPKPPQAVVPISGLFELAPLRAAFLQDELTFTPAEIRSFSPQMRVADMPCPVSLMVGDDETTEFKRQSARLYDGLMEAGRPASLSFVKGRHHNEIVADLSDPATAASRAVLSLMTQTPTLDAGQTSPA